MPIFVLDHCGARVPACARDHILPQLVDVVCRDGLGVSELAREDRRDTNLVRFDVDVRGDNRTSSVVDTFALKEYKPPAVTADRKRY